MKDTVFHQLRAVVDIHLLLLVVAQMDVVVLRELHVEEAHVEEALVVQAIRIELLAEEVHAVEALVDRR